MTLRYSDVKTGLYFAGRAALERRSAAWHENFSTVSAIARSNE
jgi:hypothetical protein